MRKFLTVLLIFSFLFPQEPCDGECYTDEEARNIEAYITELEQKNTSNSLIVKNLEEQIRDMLGKTNLPELSLFWECDNLIHGRCNNPYDLTRGPGGSSGVLVRAGGLPEFNRAALDVAVSRAAAEPDGGVVVACVPPAWLHTMSGERTLQRWVLLFCSTDRRDLLESYAVAKRVLLAGEETRVGVTIHGARRIADAERAFHHVADVSLRHLGRTLSSYGLLVDDLHIYRAIVARRPIGIEHPQSRAARALRDVARMILEDARKLAVA